MTIKPPEHFVPDATGIQVTVFEEVQVPICLPSGEQMDWPGCVQEPVEEPAAAGAAGADGLAEAATGAEPFATAEAGAAPLAAGGAAWLSGATEEEPEPDAPPAAALGAADPVPDEDEPLAAAAAG